MQQFQPLRDYLPVQLSYAGDVAARPVKTGDEAELDRVAARFKDDRNGCGRRLRCECRRSAGRGNHGHLTMNQIGRHRRQLITAVPRPAVFDRHVAAINITVLAQPFEKGRQLPLITLRRSGVQKPDHRRRWLLRARRERPRRRAAQQRDELAPLHSITSSAATSSLSGTLRPSTLAVVRLMTRSNLVGCSTGMSAGFAPRRILSTKSADLRNMFGKFGPYDIRPPPSR